jgi:phosphatidylserine/phosphatidylglycerophosphate/cardiolipin synthase-like enzyme
MTAVIAQLELIEVGWAQRLAQDIAAATGSVSMSALSMLVPQPVATNAMAHLWRAMVDAADRGVIVDVYLAAPNSFAPASRCNIQAAEKLARSACRCHLVKGPRLLHANTAVIDNHVLWVGSGNLTAAAAGRNHESWLRAECPALAIRCAARLRGLL